MKKVILSLAVIATMGFSSCKNDAKQKTETIEVTNKMANSNVSFGVRGNCGMCKKTIETAANAVDGVATAIWNLDKKEIEVSFDDAKTDAMEIHNAIAASGYDTEKVSGSEESYNGLPSCCQYDHTMAMNQSGEMKE
ncbi:heavy-metal-associated domain-containing protein [Polaribacter sp. Q13]|uniref:heavy-metal-associated domain-containing protein n=1 Tax=Polaribacter sp. Q13 TaxID=2806551 RepID=UPI00193B7663|nr:heavy-metal-associated domain-containing protein [Polaribacter sp. Q13]QVY67096.1 heavy-metal-associated domain-containing protein [Polaribacter sp. Q13]